MKLRRRDFPQPVLDVLPNGLPMVVIPLPHLAAGYASVLVRTGPRFEPPGQHGISHLCEHMLFRGAGPYRDSQELNREADRFLGALDAATLRDHAVYGASFAPGHEGEALALLGHMMIRPRLANLPVERRILLEEVREAFDENGREIDVDNLARAATFPGHPAGQSIDGHEQTIVRLTGSALRAHHRKFYVANNMVLAVAGPVDLKHTRRMAARAFAELPRGARAELPLGAPPPPRRPFYLRVSHPGAQTQLRLSYATPSALAPSAIPLQVARRVLDDGFTSRLQSELVDKRGLAYELWADLDLQEDHGAFELGATVTAGREAVTVKAMLEQVERLAKSAPSRAELLRARERTWWSLVQMHDHAASVAEWHGRALLLGRPTTPGGLMERMKGVSGRDTRHACAQVLRAERAGVTVVGMVPRGVWSAVRKWMQRAASRSGAAGRAVS